ncbi:hypothetical protein CK203_039692 [Vitis vinifera]|uniref:Uncharacterized protein n=1 Tax=Vitis vinifera TaxID=29760 RepID=A0A438HTT7_VITVI|nr:hypothetical protein CK203_039692 [Vitis vinifera]
MEVLCPKLVSAIASTPEPSAVAVGSNPALDKKPFSIRATAQPELGGLPLVRRNSATTLLKGYPYEQHRGPLSGHSVGFNGPRWQSQHFLCGLTSIRQPKIRHLPYFSYARLHNHRDNESADVCNLMRQRALLFKRLKVVETMRMYIAHNMDDSEELRSKLKSVGDELATARKVAKKGVRLLRKSKEERKTTEAEAHWLKGGDGG